MSKVLKQRGKRIVSPVRKMQTKEIFLSLLAFFYRFTYPPFDRFGEPHRMGKKGQKKEY
jgi:hypothetical protein